MPSHAEKDDRVTKWLPLGLVFFGEGGSKIFGLVMLLVCPRQCLLDILPLEGRWSNGVKCWVVGPLYPRTRAGRR